LLESSLVDPSQPFRKSKFSQLMTKKLGISAFKSRGRLLHEIPPERYRLAHGDSARPKAGDIVGLDQGFTGEDGKPMTLVYGFESSGEEAYEAELYNSDFELAAHE